MALQYSPKIVTDSLVMCLDASQNKSYPTTDLPVKGGLVMWMDAADDTTFSYSSGTTVSQWRDKSGYNYHMVPKVNGPTRSVFLNSRKVLAFTAVQTIGNDVIDLSSTTSTVFVVSRYTSGTNQRVLTCNLDSGGGNWLLGHWGGYVNQYYAEGWVSYQVYGNDTVWRVYMGDYSGPPAGANTDLANIYSNGTAIVTNSTAASGGLRKLGINYYSNETSTCEVAEIIVFNRVLTTPERRLVHTYLGQKWGILNTDRSIVDLSGFNDNGLLGDGTTANMPVYDYYNKGAFRFDGSNDFIKVGPNSSLQVNNVTIAAFFKTVNNGQSVQFIAGYGDTGIAGYWIGTSGGPIRFSIGGGSGNYLQQSSGVTPNNDQIYYVVGTYDGTNQRVYVNGVLQASATTVTGNISYTGLTDGFLVGQVQGFTAGRYLTGSVYNVSVYSRALSQAEISQNYEALKSKFANTIVQQGLVLNLDAGNPYSYAGAGAAWYDVSGSGYVSSLTNTQTYNSDNGGSINFNGSTESVSAGPNSNLFLADMTAEVWIKITAMSGDWVRIIGTGSDPRTFGLWYYVDGRILWQRTGSSAVNPEIFPATPVLTVGSWAHVAATTIGMSHVLYLNGVSIGTNPSAGGPWGNSNTAITIGYAGYHAYSNSNIASARLYTRGLSAAEILQNYNATKGRFGL
jgi:hypothetical protein